MSPTQRSLAKLRAEGWLVAIVEKWNVHARVRQDLFGFADLLAIKDSATLAVQTTSGSNVSHRLHKITDNPAATLWLRSPQREIVVHGWAKRGPRGRHKTWQCQIVSVQSVTNLPDPLGEAEGDVPTSQVSSVLPPQKQTPREIRKAKAV